MWKILLLSLVAFAAAKKVSYTNYKVFRVFPTTHSQLDTLRTLETISDEFNFWTEPAAVNATVDVMVAPHKIPDFENLMKNTETSYKTFIEDVQTLIDNENPPVVTYGFSFEKYSTLEEIYAQLDDWKARFPDKVKVVIGGRTYEGRQIKGVEITFKTGNPGIFIEGGIHAREWISPATVMYIAEQLLTSQDPDVRDLADNNNWFIFPAFNPDGYVYTHTTKRMWRKTRKPYGLICYGADPNRNWSYKWNSAGESSISCSEDYAGPSAFSEIETKSMSEYIASIANRFYAYFSFHSYSQLLLFPYGHTRDHLDNYNESLDMGQKGITALARRYGTHYVTGNIAETIYTAPGGSMDWVKGNFRQPVTFTYELRDRGLYGFLLPANQIIPTGEETLDSLVAIYKAAKTYGYNK